MSKKKTPRPRLTMKIADGLDDLVDIVTEAHEAIDWIAQNCDGDEAQKQGILDGLKYIKDLVMWKFENEDQG